jgi:hypothetical protein
LVQDPAVKKDDGDLGCMGASQAAALGSGASSAAATARSVEDGAGSTVEKGDFTVSPDRWISYIYGLLVHHFGNENYRGGSANNRMQMQRRRCHRLIRRLNAWRCRVVACVAGRNCDRTWICSVGVTTEASKNDLVVLLNSATMCLKILVTLLLGHQSLIQLQNMHK